jgi:deoxycytidylate deaminase
LAWDTTASQGVVRMMIYPGIVMALTNTQNVHAEANAVLNAPHSTEGAKLYCNLFPCNECAKIIIQKGITEIIYESDKYHDLKEYKASRKMLKLAGIKCRQYKCQYNLHKVSSSTGICPLACYN